MRTRCHDASVRSEHDGTLGNLNIIGCCIILFFSFCLHNKISNEKTLNETRKQSKYKNNLA